MQLVLSNYVARSGDGNGVSYESKTYDVSGNVHDHCPDDFVVEAMLPPPLIPGIKLGLANVVTLWLLYYATWKDALCVLLMRILIASMVTGDGILLLQPVRRSVLFRGHGTALSAAREKAHPFYQCDRCPFP